jgi:hypothetical protein
MHGDGGSLTRTSSERLTSLLTVAGDLPKRRSAQRWAGPYSHGGSQGFNSPHLHPNLAGQSVASLERAALTACWGRAGAANTPGESSTSA